jgi:hypothetical protein
MTKARVKSQLNVKVGARMQYILSGDSYVDLAVVWTGPLNGPQLWASPEQD